MDTNNQKDNEYFEIFKNIPIFHGLTNRQKELLFSISHQENLSAGDVLIKEGEDAKNFYIVVDGKLNILKYEPQYKKDFVIAEIASGETIGEMSVLDAEKRSASVQALTPAVLYKISYEKLIQLASSEKQIYMIFLNIAKHLGQRIRSTDSSYIQSLKEQLDQLKMREVMGHFIITMISYFSIFILFLPSIHAFNTNSSTTTYVTITVQLISCLFVYILIKQSGLSRERFGLTTHHWKKSAFEGIVFTIPIILVMILVKWWSTLYTATYHGRAVFELWTTYHHTEWFGHPISSLVNWSAALFLYILLGCALQEFVGRCGLQAPLSYFLLGKRKGLYSIFISDLVFSAFHSAIAFQLSFIVFLPGLYFCWLFYRHQNIIGCTIAHALIGAWALFIIRI